MDTRVLIGDCRELLPTLAAESIHCCVTSPPYWGLRDYGTGSWEGGDANCDHLGQSLVSSKSTLRNDGRKHEGPYAEEKAVRVGMPFRGICGKCGAVRIDQQIGLEESLAAHIEVLVGVFREVKRVLRPEGTLWLNYGDAYATAANGRSAAATKAVGNDDRAFRDKPFSTVGGDCKPKDLLGMPWAIAFALRADGWYLRSAITIAKVNPMPESVTDRPTSATEMLFLLTKQASYYYDADAIRERSIDPEGKSRGGSLTRNGDDPFVSGLNHRSDPYKSSGFRNRRNWWPITSQPTRGVVVYGRHRITSPDCPIHGCQAAQVHVPEDDAQPNVSLIDHNRRSDTDLAQEPEASASSTREDQCASPSGEFSARPRSSETSRSGGLLEQDETCVDRLASRIECRESAAHLLSSDDHTHGSNTSADCAADEMAACPSDETLSDNEDSVTWGDPPLECTCKHTRRAKKSLDHFASFPDALVKPCLLAGTSEKGCCPGCGAPWERDVEKDEALAKTRRGTSSYASRGLEAGRRFGSATPGYTTSVTTTGWSPSCPCGYRDTIPCTVLDPFAGSGTVGRVAADLGRKAILIELSEAYAQIQGRKLAQKTLML